jgi:hypothetical protein
MVPGWNAWKSSPDAVSFFEGLRGQNVPKMKQKIANEMNGQNMSQARKFLKSAVLGGVAVAAAMSFAAPAASADSKTLGFVITVWNTGIYESKFIDECPEGFSPGYDEIWWRGMSKEDRAKFTDNGLKSRLDRYFNAIRRGPNGEDVCMNPTVVKDPPQLIVEGKGPSYGMNLDGNADGNATPKTCKHENFTGLNGEEGVDNQVYRLLGCTYGFRSYGQYEVNANENRKSNGNGMTLIEVTGVDDEQNDPDVTVSFYRAIDGYTLDGAGRFTPFASYRIDAPDGKPRYASSLKGKIVNGVIETEPGEVNLPFYGNYTYMNQEFKDMRFKLEVTDGGAAAKGTAAGYYGIDQLLFYVTGIGPIQSSGFSNCPSLYVAAHELADGYPDPETGKCTHLSSAYNFTAVAAFIIHPEQQKTASAGSSTSGGR